MKFFILRRGLGEKIIFIFLVMLWPPFLEAQNSSYSQLSNELQFNRTINDKWSGEGWLGGTFSNTPSNSRVLSTNIQRYAFLWVNYQYSPRWKFSSSLAYYYNKDVPDIGQFLSPEYRLTLQGNYYIHKTAYILFTRFKGELRVMMNEEGVFEDRYRYRQLIKFIKPLNSKVLRKGVIYFSSSEELMFSPGVKTDGIDFFDRNRFDLGFGYMITDNLQVELGYFNEFIPRDDGNDINHAVQTTLTFNNLFLRLREKVFH